MGQAQNLDTGQEGIYIFCQGTKRQGNFFCPGKKGLLDKDTFLSQDKGTAERPHPELSQDVPLDLLSLGNPSLNQILQTS